MKKLPAVLVSFLVLPVSAFSTIQCETLLMIPILSFRQEPAEEIVIVHTNDVRGALCLVFTGLVCAIQRLLPSMV